MATVTLDQYQKRQFGGAPPYGNVISLTFGLKTDASGMAENADTATALAVGDVVILGPLPEGFRLDEAFVFVTTAADAAITGDLGFSYTDGVDDAGVPQDDKYFATGADLATAARVRASGSTLKTLPKPADLILTLGTSATATGVSQVSELTVVVTGELTGYR